jgi:hypothetical protein
MKEEKYFWKERTYVAIWCPDLFYDTHDMSIADTCTVGLSSRMLPPNFSTKGPGHFLLIVHLVNDFHWQWYEQKLAERTFFILLSVDATVVL